MRTRTTVSIVIVMALAFCAVPPASASIVEEGIGFILSAGSEKRPVEGKLVFKDQYGVVLTPSNGVLDVPAGERVRCWIFMNNAYRPKDFDIKWTLKTTLAQSNLRATEFSPDFGWNFQLDATDTALGDGSPRGLKLNIRALGAKGDYIKVFFKWTYRLSSVITNEVLIINPVPRSEMGVAGSTSGSDATATVDALRANQQRMVDRINANDDRLTGLEDWAKSASASSPAPATAHAVPATTSQTPPQAVVMFIVRFIGQNMAGKAMTVVDSAGRASFYTLSSNESQMTIPSGNYTMIVPMPDGTKSMPMAFYVKHGMEPVVVRY